MTLDQHYSALRLEPTDMQAHMSVLHALAHGRRVTEFGTRHGVSTTALLAGRPRSLTCYDLARSDQTFPLEIWAAGLGIPFTFHVGDLWNVTAIAPTDCLFIDALHNGHAVEHYLALGLNAGASVIALHDVEIFGRKGDIEGHPGILWAVDRFLDQNRDWRTTHHTDACFGMRVIAKI